jgi:two-component system CheB/CheR fusion protein
LSRWRNLERQSFPALPSGRRIKEMSDPEEDSAANKAGEADGQRSEPAGAESPAAAPVPEPAGKSESGVIVGVGASAGGLEAFSELLRSLPAITGMTFVLVQHLDPHHESILAELLGNYTRMPVVQVQDGVHVEPDRVYVIPPNARMVLSDGHLRVSRPAQELSHRRRPIDEFFVSLAETMRNRAIGVILSGAASDGTLGLKAIKGEGGITFAQDATAKFDGMPRSAIAAGGVDFVLPPRRIAEELTRLARHPISGSVADTLLGESAAMESILALIRSRVGIDFRMYKQGTVQRRVARRLAVRTMETLDDYLAILERDPAEINALTEDLLIKVTEFFRDAPEFQALKASVFPGVVEERSADEPLRIWVPGCSTGEEVYSIVISLLEYLEAAGLSRPIQMFGTDASEGVIAKARAGVYDESVVSAVDPERLRRFFTHSDSGYQINREVRDLCVFSRHILGTDPPLSRMDLVSCRNLLIYFAPALQQRVVDTLAYALRPGGFLFVGRSENTGRLSQFFDVADEQHRIYIKRPGIDASALNLIPELPWSPKQAEFRLPKPPGPGALADAGAVHSFVDHMLLSRFGPSGVVVDKDLRIVEFRGDMDRYMHGRQGAAPPRLLDAIREDLASHLQTAILEAHRRRSTVRLDEIQVRRDRAFHFVRITIIPISIPSSDPYTVILFEELAEPVEGERKPAPPPVEVEPSALENPERHIEHLERELVSSREYLQSIIEELRSTNEEAQSANEELQSSNEELQTTKEELQASNEELATMNAEMESRNLQLGAVNDDLLNLLSSISTPIVIVGNDLCIRRFTPAAEKVLRLIPTDVGRPVLDIRPRIDVPNLDEILKDVLDSLKLHEQEVQDFEGRVYLMRVRPYRTGNNRIDGAVLVLTDITDLKHGVEETMRARGQADAIVDTVREPLIVLNENLVARRANRAFYDYFHSAPERVEGQALYDIVDRQLDLPPVRGLLERLLRGESHLRDIEIEHEFQPGGSRSLLLNARRVPADGSILLAFEDITERKRAAEARYRRLFESARDGIVIIDEPTGEILDINPYAEQLFGYPRRELLGRKLWDTEPARDTPRLRAMLEQTRDQGAHQLSEATFRTKDSRAIQTEIIANLYHEGERRAIQLNIRDLTERRKFERELQNTQKLESVGLLAGGIAHDFNNLLTGIMGNASLLYGDLEAGDPSRAGLRAILSASERAADLTRQLLAYAGKGRMITERINLSELVRETVVLIRSSVPKTVDVNLGLAPDLPPVEADPSQMQQLVMNLVINAGEAIGEGHTGTIEIRTGERELTAAEVRENFISDALRPGPHVWLEVKDTGAGMDEATKAKIFDPFFTTKFTGRGLGLAAASGILKALRGAIRVYSTPGKGTTFYLLIPAVSPAPRPKQGRPEAKLRGSGTVLVIDDEETVRQTAGAILKKRGFEVLEAENGHSGVNLLREHAEQISLVILDLTMPGMSGEQTFDHLRSIRADVPIVLASGYSETEAVGKTAGRRFTGFLQKPFTVDRLIETVAAALRLKEEA